MDIPHDQIDRTYTVGPDPMGGDAWTDIREAKPRCRVRVSADAPPVLFVVTKDGTLHYDAPQEGEVEIDRYEDEAYADVRAETETK
jgi:hypothetical protein